MNNWKQDWNHLFEKTSVLKNSLQNPTQEILKSVSSYWSNELKKWIDYKEQILFPQWNQDQNPLQSFIPTLKREHQLLNIVAERFKLDPSPETYQSFIKIAHSLLQFERVVFFNRMHEQST